MVTPTVSLEGTQVLVSEPAQAISRNATAAAGVTAGLLVYSDSSGGFTVEPISSQPLSERIWVPLFTAAQNQQATGVRGARVRLTGDGSISAGAAIKPSTTTAGYVTSATESSDKGTGLIVGYAITACSGNAAQFLAYFGDMSA